MVLKSKLIQIIACSSLLGVSTIYAATVTVPMHLVAATGQGKTIGNITLEDAKCGVLITPNLHDLPPGVHGFHVHVTPNCGDHGMAAGGHLDPAKTEEHQGPYKHGSHLGDLPILVVDKDGKANLPVLAPRFTVQEIKGHALMIHAGGDNYSDVPEKLGGGGDRIACGIIPTNGMNTHPSQDIVVPATKSTTTETTIPVTPPETSNTAAPTTGTEVTGE